MRTFPTPDGMPGRCRNSVETGNALMSSLSTPSLEIFVSPNEIFFSFPDATPGTNMFSLDEEDLRKLSREIVELAKPGITRMRFLVLEPGKQKLVGNQGRAWDILRSLPNKKRHNPWYLVKPYSDDAIEVGWSDKKGIIDSEGVPVQELSGPNARVQTVQKHLAA